MHTIIIPDNSYGAATLRIRNTISKCQAINWFLSDSQSISKNDILKYIHDFSMRIRRHFIDMPSQFNVDWLEGGWSILHQNHWGHDPYYPWGHRFDDSIRVLGKIVRNIKDIIIRSPQLLSLIKPPLWPISGNPNIAGPPIIAREDVFRVAGLNLQYGSPDWNVAWGLLCQVEFYIWGHLLYDLLGDIAEETNPFEPLLNICANSCFPLGWENSYFYIYFWRVERCQKMEKIGVSPFLLL